MNAEFLWVLIFFLVALLFLVPLMVYQAVKMGTFGYLKAKYQFEQNYKKEMVDDDKP